MAAMRRSMMDGPKQPTEQESQIKKKRDAVLQFLALREPANEPVTKSATMPRRRRRQTVLLVVFIVVFVVGFVIEFIVNRLSYGLGLSFKWIKKPDFSKLNVIIKLLILSNSWLSLIEPPEL